LDVTESLRALLSEVAPREAKQRSFPRSGTDPRGSVV
jgi:hypothetical protein